MSVIDDNMAVFGPEEKLKSGPNTDSDATRPLVLMELHLSRIHRFQDDLRGGFGLSINLTLEDDRQRRVPVDGNLQITVQARGESYNRAMHSWRGPILESPRVFEYKIKREDFHNGVWRHNDSHPAVIWEYPSGIGQAAKSLLTVLVMHHLPEAYDFSVNAKARLIVSNGMMLSRPLCSL